MGSGPLSSPRRCSLPVDAGPSQVGASAQDKALELHATFLQISQDGEGLPPDHPHWLYLELLADWLPIFRPSFAWPSVLAVEAWLRKRPPLVADLFRLAVRLQMRKTGQSARLMQLKALLGLHNKAEDCPAFWRMLLTGHMGQVCHILFRGLVHPGNAWQ